MSDKDVSLLDLADDGEDYNKERAREMLSKLEATPNDDLWELVEQWRGHVERLDLPRSGLTNEGHAVKQCADELEELLE